MNSIFLLLAILVGSCLAIVHYSIRAMRQKNIIERLNNQDFIVTSVKKQLKHLERESKDFKLRMATRELLLDTEVCLKHLQEILSVDTFDEIEWVLDLLEDRPVPAFETSRAKSDLFARYEYLRGWHNVLTSDIQSLLDGTQEEASKNTEASPKKKRNRRNTYLNLRAAGINLPNSQ